MILPKFEDKYPGWDSGGGYKVTNESPEEFVKMLGDRRFPRGASICSGGEVPLFIFLPRCDEVFAIDHALGSLATTWVKALMLSHLGPIGFMNAICGSHKNFMAEAHNIVSGNVPEPLQKHVKLAWDGNIVTQYSINFSIYDMESIRNEWKLIGDKTIQQVFERLDRLTLVHGDVVEDLPSYGVFDLLYISNACEHNGRKIYEPNYGPRLPNFEPLVNVGGILLATGGLYNMQEKRGPKVTNGKWKTLRTNKSDRTSWEHHALERTAEDVVLHVVL